MDISTRLRALIEERGVRILGISGPPGSGKSTVARELVRKDTDGVVISMDDFYLSKAERERRDLAWRGPPGSHDLAAMIDVLRRIKDADTPITMPRFDPSTDDRTANLVLTTAPRLAIVEGFYLGYARDGYEDLLPFIDLLVFLDVDVAVAKERRFAREADLRAYGGGFTEDQMQHFWDEVLGPGIERWTKPARASADVILSVAD